MFRLLFLESIEDFEHSIMQKKMKIPKMSNRNTVENHFGEERMPLRHKKVGIRVFKKGYKIWETVRQGLPSSVLEGRRCPA